MVWLLDFFLVLSFCKNLHILSLGETLVEAVDNGVPDFEELIDKLIRPM